MAYIELSDVSRDYRVYKRKKGLGGSIRMFFSREHEIVRAVDHVSLEIQKR